MFNFLYFFGKNREVPCIQIAVAIVFLAYVQGAYEMKIKVMLSGILLCGVMGCGPNRPVRGWMNQSQSSHSFMDFKFVDEHGRARSLRNVLGDYTVVAITRCDKDTHQPATSLLEKIVSENLNADYVKVVGVDIHWMVGGCRHKGQCHLLLEQGNLVSICDAKSAIQRLYSAKDRENKLYLISPEKKIILSSSVREVGKLRDMLKMKVTELSRERAEQFTQEPEDLSQG